MDFPPFHLTDDLPVVDPGFDIEKAVATAAASYLETDNSQPETSTEYSKVGLKCPTCYLVYKTEEDVVAHAAFHYPGRPLSALSSTGSGSSSASSSLPNSPNSVDIGPQGVCKIVKSGLKVP